MPIPLGDTDQFKFGEWKEAFLEHVRSCLLPKDLENIYLTCKTAEEGAEVLLLLIRENLNGRNHTIISFIDLIEEKGMAAQCTYVPILRLYQPGQTVRMYVSVLLQQ